MFKIKPTDTYNKKLLFIGGFIFSLTIYFLISFFIQLTNIKKDNSTAVYGVDLISYYTAAKLIEEGDISEIYVETKDDFSVVNSGKFFESVKNEDMGPSIKYLLLLMIVPAIIMIVVSGIVFGFVMSIFSSIPGMEDLNMVFVI